MYILKIYNIFATMIYNNIHRYNCNLIVNYLNDTFNFKLYSLFKYIEYVEDTEASTKTIILAIDGKSAKLIFAQDDEIVLLNSDAIFGRIDLKALRVFLITTFRDITIDKIIENA